MHDHAAGNNPDTARRRVETPAERADPSLNARVRLLMRLSRSWRRNSMPGKMKAARLRRVNSPNP